MRRGSLLAAAVWATASPALANGILFEDHSASLPAHAYKGGWEHFVGGGAAVFDCNDDGLPEIYAAGGSSPAILIENRGGMQFAPAEAPALTGVTGAYPLDMDGDGLLDLMVLRVGENVILRGEGGCRFTRANEVWGYDGGDGWTTAFSATWDGDTLISAEGNYVDRADPDGPFEACDTNRLIRWLPDGPEAEILAPGHCALSMLFARDASGKTRLRISNDRHYYVRDGTEQMYDLTEARFLGPEDGWETLRLWGMGIASRDITGDGRSEVMLTSMGDQLMQIAQSDGTYVAAPYGIGTYAQRPHVGDDGRPSTGWHAEFADINNDGRADLFIAKGNVDQMPGLAMEDPNSLLEQQADGTFQEISVAAGVATVARSRGASLADFDGDGRLDLLVVNRRVPLELYRNVTQVTGNWLQVSLRMDGSNTRAVGALVEMFDSKGRQVQEVTVGGGHASGHAGPLHFGAGGAEAVNLRITWPNGDVSDYSGVTTGQHLTLRP